MDSIKLINEWKNNPEFKVLYDIIKQPIEAGGFDIEHVYLRESTFNNNNDLLQGIIKIHQNDLAIELILNKVTDINILDYQTLNDVTISIENGENNLVFLVKVINDIVVSVNFNDGIFKIKNTKSSF